MAVTVQAVPCLSDNYAWMLRDSATGTVAICDPGEAARRSGVPESTLKRWADQRVLPVKGGRWTIAVAAQARVIARMRERGHSLGEIRGAVRDLSQLRRA